MKEAAALPRGGRHRAPLRPLPAMDLPFLVLVLTLVGFGLVMLGSASGAVALYQSHIYFSSKQLSPFIVISSIKA